ncbi:MAG: GTPase [Aureliella sp.]
MSDLSEPSQPTLAARLTPAIPAAIATIAVRGPLAAQILTDAFRTPRGQAAAWRCGQVRFGRWNLSGSDVPPEHVVVCQLDDDHFEIHCHGGLAVSDWILGDLESGGCAICAANEWPTDRAGRIEAAAELALARAATLKVAAVLLDQAGGSLTRELRAIAAAIAGSRLETAREVCADLLGRAELGMKLLEPWRLTMAGPPNVGKSSLTNALIGAARMLVHHEPGTTRDAVESSIVISSWPVVLTDTAGVREPAETIERQGIDAARLRWRDADIGLLVVDATVGWTSVHRELLSQRTRDTLLVINKRDLRNDMALPEEVLASDVGVRSLSGAVKVVATDATSPTGVAELLAVLGEHLDSFLPPPGAAVPFLEEHVALLREVERNLAEGNPELAARALAGYLS